MGKPKGQAAVEYLLGTLGIVIAVFLVAEGFWQKRFRDLLIDATEDRLEASQELLRLPIP